jgi:Flp pilus assembly protein TadD
MNNKFIIPLLFSLLVAAIYGNTLQTPFVFDDFENIYQNSAIRVEALTVDNLLEAGFSGPCYRRPVANIMFALNYLLGGYHVIGYHLVNIIIHWLCGFFIYLLFGRTLKTSSPENSTNRWIAFLAALLWMVHPIQTQGVTYIVQRMTSLSALFYVMSLYFYDRGRSHRQGTAVDQGAGKTAAKVYFIASFLAGVLALGSKEVAATLPFFIFLYEWYFIQDLNADWLRRHIPYLGITLAILGLVSLVYLDFDPMEKILAGYGQRDFTLLQRLLTEPRVVFFYISLIFFPHPSRLNLDHDIAISQSLVEPATTMLAIAGLAGLFVLAVVLARRHRLLSFGILWYLGNLVIESSVIGLEIIFEHRNYLPSMFLMLALVLVGFKLLRHPKAAVTVFVGLAVILSFWTLQRNAVWKEELTLWQDCAAKSPDKARPHYNMALILAEKGQSEEATRLYRRALAIKPDSATFNTNLAIELSSQGDLDAAIFHYKKALEIEPNFFHAHMNLGKILIQSGKRKEGMAHIEKAMSIKPDSAGLNNILGLIKLDDNDLKSAARYFAKALKNDPYNDQAYNNLGVTLTRDNRFDQAAKLFSKAAVLNPSNKDARRNLKTVIRAMIDRNRRQLAVGINE